MSEKLYFPDEIPDDDYVEAVVNRRIAELKKKLLWKVQLHRDMDNKIKYIISREDFDELFKEKQE